MLDWTRRAEFPQIGYTWEVGSLAGLSCWPETQPSRDLVLEERLTEA